MKRLFLLAVLAALVVATVPPLRERAAPHVRPILARAEVVLDPLISRLLDPVFRWSARSEEQRYITTLQRRIKLNEPLPGPRDFQRFLAENAYSGRSGRDPWGSPYYLVITRDSIRVGSPGPDMKRGTADDIVESGSRR